MKGADDYEILVKETSAIIRIRPSHTLAQLTSRLIAKDNQWQMDIDLNVRSFEPSIAGVRNLINISNQVPKSPPILFTSSISILGNRANKDPGKVPEPAFYNFSITAAMGYGE